MKQQDPTIKQLIKAYKLIGKTHYHLVRVMKPCDIAYHVDKTIVSTIIYDLKNGIRLGLKDGDFRDDLIAIIPLKEYCRTQKEARHNGLTLIEQEYRAELEKITRAFEDNKAVLMKRIEKERGKLK